MNQIVKSKFGELLVKFIKEANMSQRTFYEELGITKPYFYDILSGRINPPPSEVQIKMLNVLSLDEEKAKELFDIAGKLRNEIPADISLYIANNNNVKTDIRNKKEFKSFYKKFLCNK